MRSRFGVVWCELLIPGAVLLACFSPSYAADCPECLLSDPGLSAPCPGSSLSAPGYSHEPLPGMAKTRNVKQKTVGQMAQNVPGPPTPTDSDPAQPGDPNQDRFLQPPPTPTPAPTADPPLTSPTPSTPAQPDTTSQPIAISRIEVTGSTVFSPADFQPIINPFQGRSVTLEELRGVADAITQLYLDRGYITSRAVLVDQTITDGVVQIRVIEGGLERIDVEGTQRVNPDYIRSRIALAGVKPLSQNRLEDQLRLLRADPLFENVEASLRAGTQFGQSILTVRVTESEPFTAVFSIDNFSPPSVGSERLGVGLSYRNFTGFGDQFTASYSRSTTGGAVLYDLSYRLILNPMNGTLQFRYAPNDFSITDPTFVAFGIRGESDLYEVSFRQPLVRSPREELALSLGFTHQSGQTFLFSNLATPFGFGPDANGISRTSVFKFGQDYVLRDVQGAWAFRSQFSFGTGLLDATSNAPPIPDSNFFSWLAQAQRVQLLSNDQILVIQADLQLTPDSLLPSQQFVIGGGQSVRGYRQNARSGDNGFRFSVENRIVVQRDEAGTPLVQLAPFIDLGAVWNSGGNPNLLPSQTFLVGAGVGFIWQPLPKLGARIDFALPFINLNDRGSNLQDAAVYFNINYQL